ncbi:MAG: 4Fe-4S dicluster domain-containing protein [Dehalococcoidia bacterium]|nr:4Fe-4S dicluster domain-containing protein [Dehalococcoidia bacterium]
MSKSIVVNPDRCTGCRICELVCSLKHHGEYNPVKSRIKVNIFPRDFFFYPNVCSQCENAWCARICPAGALSRHSESGVVELDEMKCVGCKMCMQACPFGTMGYDSDRGISEKCDLCGGDPECVKHCFYNALEYKEPEVAMSHKGKVFVQKIMKSYATEVTR